MRARAVALGIVYELEQDDRAMETFAAIEQSVPVGEAAQYAVVCLALAERAVLAEELGQPDADNLLRRAEAFLRQHLAESAHHPEIADWLTLVSGDEDGSNKQP